MLCPDVAKSLPCWLSQFSFSKLRQPTGQRQSNVRMQQKKSLIGPILFLYYEENLVSSNLNSKLLTFHCAHPNLHVAIFLFSLTLLKKSELFFSGKIKCANYGKLFLGPQRRKTFRPKFLVVKIHTPNPNIPLKYMKRLVFL